MSTWAAQDARNGADQVIGSDPVEIALLRCGVYRTLARALDRPSAGARLVLEDDWEMLTAALRVLGVRLPEGATGPVDATGDLDAWARAFGHTARAGVCPFETEYGDTTARQAHELADIAGFFRAFGLALDLETHERPDHIRCELEFMGFLTRKEAVARAQEDHETLASTLGAERSFLRDHLGRFGAAFASQLERHGPNGFYHQVAETLRPFVLSECVRHDVPTGPDLLTLSPEEEDVVPMACGEGGCSPGDCGV